MVGIRAISGYIPRFRLNRETIFKAMGWFSPATATVARGERSVANYDEDSITMAVTASMNCLKTVDRKEVGGAYLASTTFPYAQRQNASIFASALDLREDVGTADFSGTLKSGTAALLAAVDAIDGGREENVLVAAADCRACKLGSTEEHLFGDGAAALVLGKENVVAEVKGSFSITKDFPDYIRAEGKPFSRAWEERWILKEGYGEIIPQLIKGLLEKYDLKMDDFSKVIYPCHFKRSHMAIARKLGIDKDQLQDNLHEVTGDTGTAHPFVMLAIALENAKQGDRILMVSYGSGGDAIFLEVTNGIQALEKLRTLSYYLGRKRELGTYEKYMAIRKLGPLDLGYRGEAEPATALSMLWRKRKAVLGLIGSRCKACGTPQFPPQRICVNPECGKSDQMEEHRFSDRHGTIFTYTGDMLAFSYDPPQIYGLIDMDDGGRLFLDFTDCDLQDLKVGNQVEMNFRRKYVDEQRGIHGYFWKAVPL